MNCKKINTCMSKDCKVVSLNPAVDQDEATKIITQLADDIAAKEAECLRLIHSRYCILNAKPLNVSDVYCYTPFPETRKNYREYWYKWKQEGQYFLMGKELILDNGVPKLNIFFNKELAREGENSK